MDLYNRVYNCVDFFTRNQKAVIGFSKAYDIMLKLGIDTEEAFVGFISTCAHESAFFSKTEENLNYSAESLMACWPHRFDADKAKEFARKPEKIANEVYGGRMGNVNPGDGWKYRGGAFIQITGHNNYEAVSKLTGIDFVDDPSKVREDFVVCWAASAAIFSMLVGRGTTALAAAKAGDYETMNEIVNGGTIGMKHRLMYAKVANALITGDTTELNADAVLKEGSSESFAVKELQERLKRFGFYTSRIDGDFGPGTTKAVKAFQTKSGLVSDGIVGVKTWKAVLHLDSIHKPDETVTLEKLKELYSL